MSFFQALWGSSRLATLQVNAAILPVLRALLHLISAALLLLVGGIIKGDRFGQFWRGCDDERVLCGCHFSFSAGATGQERRRSPGCPSVHAVADARQQRGGFPAIEHTAQLPAFSGALTYSGTRQLVCFAAPGP